MTEDCNSSALLELQGLHGRKLRGAAAAQSLDQLTASNHPNLKCPMEMDSSPCGAIPLVHRNKECIVGCGQEGASVEGALILLRVLPASPVPGSRCAERWGSPRG